ncbi:hypothetical protein NXX23_09925 [Bacteroides ovatus]|nr:hypothetical protein [Bacteroides ovatus]
MGNNFEDWANSYFSPDSEHLDCFIVREKYFADYKSFSGVNKITMQRFTKTSKVLWYFAPTLTNSTRRTFATPRGVSYARITTAKYRRHDLSAFMRHGGNGCRWWNGTGTIRHSCLYLMNDRMNE